jgi:hypothetical protein
MIRWALVTLVFLPYAAAVGYASPEASRGAQALPHGLAERGIPKGELSPQVVEKAYDTPRGEVHFTIQESSGNRSGYLRNVRGGLMTFSEVRGGRDCEDWFQSAKVTQAPKGCEFLFYDSYDGRTISVRSEEMAESSLFDVTSDALHATTLSADKGGTHVAL